jgi:hypothetical protein
MQTKKVEKITDQFVDIPAKRREMYFKIIDNYPNFHLITLRLYFLDSHFPPLKLDSALRWLLNARLTGYNFIGWWTNVCKGSDLEMHRILLAILDKMPIASVIAGRNFKS